jgi:hypothetical protein
MPHHLLLLQRHLLLETAAEPLGPVCWLERLQEQFRKLLRAATGACNDTLSQTF